MDVITRVAGIGGQAGQGNSGDGGPAIDAELSNPIGVAATADGGFLIADFLNNEVRMVSAAGVITRVAGTGARGNFGDGGPAIDAELNMPAGVAVTADGGFLIVDGGNNVVRKVSAAGVITRVAGNGTPGNSGNGGPATDAQLNNPYGVAVTADGGFLIADYVNNEVRMVSAAGVITRVAGTGIQGNSGDGGPAIDAELNYPTGVAVTADGGFLIADYLNNEVRMVSAAGVITRVAGNGIQGNSGDGGPAIDAELSNPTGVAVTADGGFLIADPSNYEVRIVSAAGVITRVAGNGTPGGSGDGGPATYAQLNYPLGVAVTADGGFLIADSGNNEVRKVVEARLTVAVITRVAGTGAAGGSGSGGQATDAQLTFPLGVAVTAEGGFLIADPFNNEVRKVSAAGVITRVAGNGTPGNSGDGSPATDAQLNFPAEVAVTADGGFLIADTDNHEVRKVSAAGVITRVAGTGTPGNSGDGSPATDAQLDNPAGVAVTADGGFLIADAGNSVVRKVSAAGVITRVAGNGAAGGSGDGGPAIDAQLNYPLGVAVTADGGFLIADRKNHEVRKVSAAGVITRVAGTGTPGNSGDGSPATDAQLNFPAEVAVTADGGFLIADTDNHEVRKVSAAGVITRVAGNGTPGDSGDDGPATDAQLNRPYGVAVSADGGFLIADSRNNEVRKVEAGVALGVIIRVAGTGTPGNSGDGGPARDAQLNSPHGVAVTLDGGFLIADTVNNEVRMVSAAGVITRVAGTGTPGDSGDGGPALDAQLRNPIGVVANITFLGFLIADSGNSVVRQADYPFGPGAIGRVAGTGTRGNSGDELNFPLGVAVTADGGFLIADTYNHVVRKESAVALITVVAGTGTPGDSGDGGPAIDAQLNMPAGVAATADGGFLIVDNGNNQVRKVSAAGVITRVAGNGTPGNSGDDGPAADAQLNRPIGVAVTADAGFLIADSGNHVVRKVSAAGVITRVAGNGTPGNSGDGGPATDAQLYVPYGVAVTADGGFLISDNGNHVVRMVSTA